MASSAEKGGGEGLKKGSTRVRYVKGTRSQHHISLYEREQNALADEMVAWSKTLDPLGRPWVDLRPFFLAKGMSLYEFKKTAKINDYMSKALTIAGEQIGVNVRYASFWHQEGGDAKQAHTLLREFDVLYKEADQEEWAARKDAPQTVMFQPTLPMYAEMKEQVNGDKAGLTKQISAKTLSDESFSGDV